MESINTWNSGNLHYSSKPLETSNVTLPPHPLLRSPAKKRSHSDNPLSPSYTSLQFNVSTIANCNFFKKPKMDHSILVNQELNFLLPELQIQIRLITTTPLFFNLNDLEKEETYALIHKIYTNYSLTTEEKCAELGMLYFYIASEKELPQQPHLLVDRIIKITTKANYLMGEHQKISNPQLQKLIPSGCTAYLLHTFVRMILTSDGRFNPGGCLAIKMMLVGPIKLLINEEQRDQVIRILDLLLSNKTFRNQLTNLDTSEENVQTFQINKGIEELIGIDMNLPQEKQVHAMHVRWDLLMALFTIPGQIPEEGNCYAVATAANIATNIPQEMLKQLIEVVKTGKLFFQGKNIPILPLLESARRYENDFKETISQKLISGSTPISLAKECLKHAYEPLENEHDELDLNSFMTLQFGNDSEYVKQVYLSLKQNLLQQSYLSIIRFVSNNMHQSTEFATKNPYRISQKTYLIFQFLHLFSEHIKNNHIDTNQSYNFPSLLEKLRSQFIEHFYLVDYFNWNMTFENDKVTFDYHEVGLNFNGKEKEYKNFKNERRLLFLKEEELLPVDSISKLKEFFNLLINKLQLADGSLPQEEINYLSRFVESPNFKAEISNILYKINQPEAPIEAKIYSDSDSFFIAQNGGDTNFIQDWEPIKNYFRAIEIRSTSVGNLINQLCTTLNLDTQPTERFLLKAKSWVLIDCNEHVYNLYPFLFQEYINTHPIEKINADIINRANKIKTFTKDKKERALAYTFGENISDLKLKELIVSRFSASKFYKNARTILDKSFHEKLRNSIDRVMNEIPVKNIRKNLSYILAAGSQNSANFSNLKAVISNIEMYTANKNYISPYRLAYLIHSTLISCNPPVLFPIENYEKQIRNIFSLPAVIHLGNLNWTVFLNEKPAYCYLIIKYDFTKQCLILAERIEGHEKPLSRTLSNSILEETNIYLPLYTAI